MDDLFEVEVLLLEDYELLEVVFDLDQLALEGALIAELDYLYHCLLLFGVL